MSTSAYGPGLDRRGAWVMLGVGAVVWLGLAAWLVPWEWAPRHITPAAAEDYFTPVELARAEDYAGYVRPRADAALATGLAVALLLGLTRRGRRRVVSITSRLPWWAAVPLAVLVFEVLVRAVRLPFAWQIRSRRLEEGLTEQSASGWWADVGLSLLVTWGVGSLAVLIVVGCARRWPRRWYLAVGGTALVAIYAISMAYPLVVEPLFNRFSPLADGPLRAQLVAMAEEQGVDVGEVLVADASRRTTTLNAYVSGLGETKRLVLYDTLVAGAPDDEVIAVAAHEVAHAANDDVLVGTTLGAVGAAVAVPALALVLDARRLRSRTPPQRAAVTWTVLALVAVATVLAAPVQSTISRAIETRADVHALATTGDPGAFSELQVRLAQRSLADPDPPAWRQLWWGSHPTVLERLGAVDDR